MDELLTDERNASSRFSPRASLALSPTLSSPIHIKGARTHNLKDVELTIPRHQLTVITGVSGSGKSSLAFDTLHAEGSRQYLESLSAKARGLLESVSRPDVDFIRGLSLSSPSRNGRVAIPTRARRSQRSPKSPTMLGPSGFWRGNAPA